MYKKLSLALMALAYPKGVRGFSSEILDAMELTSRAFDRRRLQASNSSSSSNSSSNATSGNESSSNVTAGNSTSGNMSSENSSTTPVPSNITVNTTTPSSTNITGMFDFESWAAAYMNNNMSDMNCSETCCQCVASYAKELMTNATTDLNATCSPTGPEGGNMGTQAACNFFVNQPNVTTGLLIGYGDVANIANAYCVGNGSCAAPAISNVDVCPASSTQRLNASDAVTAQLVLSGRGNIRGLGVSYVTCLLNTGFSIMDSSTAADDIYCTGIIAANSSPPSGNSSDSTDNATSSNFSAVPTVTIVNNTDSTDASLSSQVCQYDIRVCEWSSNHPDVAWGIRYSYVQPMKFARGFCAGLLVSY